MATLPQPKQKATHVSKYYKTAFLGIGCFVIGLITHYFISTDGFKYRRYIDRNPDGSIHIDAFYDKFGNRQGVQKVYYDNGNLKVLNNFENGEVEGMFIGFYENGDLESLLNYKNGKLTGKVYYFHKGGRLSQEEHYVEGLKHGEFKYYDSLGVLIETNKYDMSKLVSKWTID